MENISRHIEYLLLRHDCVILPGIGAFINIYQAPYFDDASGKILPPSREIRFNPALRSDDGMLANSIARKMAVPYREGSEILSKAVADFGQTLLSEQEVTVGRLGIIRREEEGNLRFYPFKSIEKRCNEIGLIAAPVAKKSTIVSSVKVQSSSRTLDISEAQNDFSSSILNREKPEEERMLYEKIGKMNFKRNYYLPINKLFVKACACLLIVAAFAVGWLNTPDISNKKEERASVLPIDKMIDSAVQKVQANEKEPPLEVLEEVTTQPEDHSYHLIVATCTSNEEALRFIKAVSPTGFDLQVLPSKKLYRVSAIGSDNRQELVEIMRSAEFQQAFKEAWIWDKQ
ncbi:MAG: hypothetical protein K2H96_11635 [Muribaculaceae bacterium]|nr:hypothetical protein [Muribaculaceae bacterium]